MVENDEGLEKLCLIYGKLDDREKGKLIEFGEGLFKSQKIIETEISVLTCKNENTELKNCINNWYWIIYFLGLIFKPDLI